MAYQAMKPTKPGLEETQEGVHRIRITLSSKNVQNLEKDICGGSTRLWHSDWQVRKGGHLRSNLSYLTEPDSNHVEKIRYPGSDYRIGPMRRWILICSVECPSYICRHLAPFHNGIYIKVVGNATTINVRDIMPIATGHEREELEATLKVTGMIAMNLHVSGLVLLAADKTKYLYLYLPHKQLDGYATTFLNSYSA
ncbi:hypothetical protein CASFOL_017958 [Castilleja foliolosa]|uniref:Uncharacterized protein n=1 Tax=Castilleja foliolosa TaxID=1961234 RepID=A0ABD3DA68_9LAMI